MRRGPTRTQAGDAPAIALATALTLGLGALSSACATTTRVQLDCIPERVPVYVDGELLEDPSEELFLRSDEPHKIFVKAPGYEPQLVVLESLLDAEGRPRDREEVCIELVPVGQRRQLELETEEPAAP